MVEDLIGAVHEYKPDRCKAFGKHHHAPGVVQDAAGDEGRQ